MSHVCTLVKVTVPSGLIVCLGAGCELTDEYLTSSL